MTSCPNITFSSCLYQLKNRHGSDKHMEWFRDFIKVVNRFYLVIYTGENEYSVIQNEISRLDENTQHKIKVVVKPFTEFQNYKHERFWRSNNERTENMLRNIADWRLSMLWCEKTHLVKETIEKRYFDTEYYGWCDIGYFRDTLSASTPSTASPAYRNIIREHWPNPTIIQRLHKDKVYYGCNIQPKYMDYATKWMTRHFHTSNIDSTTGIPRDLYRPDAHYFSGGFYITGREKALWWNDTFQSALEKYINASAFLKDDQHIISYCAFRGSRDQDFCVVYSNDNNSIDKPWFLFRDFLLE